MAGLSMKHREELSARYAERLTFDRTERTLYGHDIGEMPPIIAPLVGSTVPDAVVQPQSEAELVDLVRWAGERRIPLTPRGKATSGYGGVLPVRGGIVVDFWRMRAVVDIDEGGLSATVEPGIVWERLDQLLADRGLTLRLYPTSYPSSTVGGWLAQGGAGIGSFASGWFRENVVSARLVLPSGEVRVLRGAELDLVSDAGGITGLISSVTVRVERREELAVAAVAFPTAEGLQGFAQALVAQSIPIWSFLFINPRMAALKNKVPLRERLGHHVGEHVELPEEYIATLTWKAADSAAVSGALVGLAGEHGGKRLSEEIARHEWEKRFRIMQVKRLGPSLVPAEVAVPLESLASMLEEVGRRISQPVVKEGIVIRDGRGGKPEVVLLGFIPADKRRLSYPLLFSLSLSITRIAERHGGRAYATGLYFTGKARGILGDERLARLRRAKREIDPAGIMNPGKVVSGSPVALAIGVAGAFEPITRFLGNRMAARIGERFAAKPARGIPAEVAWHAYSCSQCGYCVDSCDQFYGRGWESQSPRGKWYWLREYMEGREKLDQRMVDTFMVCTTCETCNIRCSESFPIETSWMKLRGKLIHEDGHMIFPPFEMMAAALQSEGNIWAGYRKNRLDWFPEDLRERHGPGKRAKVAYFAGCTASYVENDIAIATVRLLDAAGVDFTHAGPAENCCGTPMLVAGKWDLFLETLRKNVAAVKATGADTVVSSCPACDMMWRHVYPQWAEKAGIEYGITARHYSEVVTEKIKSGELRFPRNGKKTTKVTWHDSCHIGRVSGVYEPPRELIRAVPGTELVEMRSNREAGKCCGSVLTLIKEPLVAAEIGKERLEEAMEAGAEKVLALCPCCEFQLRVSAEKKKLPVEVVDLARYAAEALGHELPDPNPEVHRQWAVFEAMIALMTPQGFADLMGSMWPELIRSMPFGMGGMMRLMGKIPLTLELMKPLFPVLFPVLLPTMMPKVMSVMLERVKERVPMPDYMAEQMPSLMPKVMDNLMPHMIRDVVPLVTQPMIDYLRGRAQPAGYRGVAVSDSAVR